MQSRGLLPLRVTTVASRIEAVMKQLLLLLLLCVTMVASRIEAVMKRYFTVTTRNYGSVQLHDEITWPGSGRNTDGETYYI